MDFAIYVARTGWRRFAVAIYEISDGEAYRERLKVRTFFRRRALQAGQVWADAYFCDQAKRRRSLAMLVLPQPDSCIRIVGDESPENRKP